MSNNFVTYELDGPVALIGLNRPDKRNAINEAVIDELRPPCTAPETRPMSACCMATASTSAPASIWVKRWPALRSDEAAAQAQAPLLA